MRGIAHLEMGGAVDPLTADKESRIGALAGARQLHGHRSVS
jgi:hypothetical protein